LSRVAAAGLLSAVATLGVWLLLLLGAWAVAGIAGSPSPITELVGIGFPVAAALLAPVVAGVIGGFVVGRMPGLLSAIVGYVVVTIAMSVFMWASGIVGMALVIGIPLIVLGHWAGAAARPRQVRPA
jgi:hypothetical protein